MKPSLAAAISISMLASSLTGAPTAGADPQVLSLWPEGIPGALPNAGDEQQENGRVWNVQVPTLAFYPAPRDKAVGTAVVICPGGGYARLSVQREGSDVATRLNESGVSAFVLRYRLKEYGQPAPLRDVLRAIRLVRSRAEEFGVRPDRIGVMGFSAGGHLAASAATLYDLPDGRTGAALDAVDARPDFAVLIYPVITMTPATTHMGSRQNLIGDNPTSELAERYSLETRVTAKTPPSFLVHSCADRTVPLENSLLYFAALRRAGVPAELHLFERGGHGYGLDGGLGPTSDWPRRLTEWMADHGWLATAP